MKIEIIKCDICGADGAKTCWLTVDRRMDPAGSMEDESDDIDLCGEHGRAAFLIAANELNRDVRRGLMQRLRAMKKQCST